MEFKVYQDDEGREYPVPVGMTAAVRVENARQWEAAKAAPANYIKVDEEFPGEVCVYDLTGELHNTFEGDDAQAVRRAAEAFARKQADYIGCEWGSNY